MIGTKGLQMQGRQFSRCLGVGASSPSVVGLPSRATSTATSACDLNVMAKNNGHGHGHAPTHHTRTSTSAPIIRRYSGIHEHRQHQHHIQPVQNNQSLPCRFDVSSSSNNNNNNNISKSQLTATNRYFSSSNNSSNNPPAPRKKKKMTTISIQAKARKSKKITMVTAYDYPSAVHVDRAGIDIVLVGDSCAMVELGFETTQPITLDQMIHHCQAVKRGAPNRPLLVGDMPFGSYEFKNVDIALQNAYRMVKEGGMDAVKFEGGTEARAKIVRHVVEGGVAVLGHVGLTPQAISVLGGFRAQGRTASRARLLIDEALRLQDAGAFAIVLECIPANVATAITDALDIPTIGIGAGGGTSGQVLVFHDLLGMLSHPHHEEFVPKFCKKYASVGIQINDGLAQFKKEVEDGVFPGAEYSPYKMNAEEEARFDEVLLKDANDENKLKSDATTSKLDTADASGEELSLYGNNKQQTDK